MLRGFRIRSAIAAFATLCVASAASAPARAEATRVGGVYGVLFSGIPIARATFSLVIDGDAYSLKIKMRPAAVGRAVSSGTVDAEAAGWYKNGALIPARFTAHSEDEEDISNVQMLLGDGAVQQSSASPALSDAPDRVPLTSADLKGGIFDPASAALLSLARPSDVGTKAVCDQDIKVFDGWTRFNIPLSYRSTENVETPSYKGTVVNCAARWVPVAGHRPNKKTVVFMKNNKRIGISYAPIGRSGLMVPFRVTVGTLYGTLTLVAEDIKATGPLAQTASN